MADATPKDPQPSARRTCGQRLRNLLEEYGISHSAFADVLGVSPQCITNWSSRGIPRLWVEPLARLLSVSEEWLTTGEGKRTRDLHREVEQDQTGLRG
ncbi:helix-turn-helix domain-containing protein [Pseudomonas brassicacearum]|uniref:helix-turn-helix domain-containing protein n=1 Tax=Pseudomonas brassicacearum TaxID=930166 RepID=UPI0009B7FF51